MSEQTASNKLPTTGLDTVLLIYVLYLAGAFTVGTLTVIGGLWALYERQNADKGWKTHYEYIIDTAWKSTLFVVVGALTLQFIIGIFIMIGWFFWMLGRAIKGIVALRDKQPIEDPTRWGI